MDEVTKVDLIQDKTNELLELLAGVGLPFELLEKCRLTLNELLLVLSPKLSCRPENTQITDEVCSSSLSWKADLGSPTTADNIADQQSVVDGLLKKKRGRPVSRERIKEAVNAERTKKFEARVRNYCKNYNLPVEEKQETVVSCGNEDKSMVKSYQSHRLQKAPKMGFEVTKNGTHRKLPVKRNSWTLKNNDSNDDSCNDGSRQKIGVSCVSTNETSEVMDMDINEATHEKVHDESNWLQCAQCDFKTVQKYSMALHMQRKHNAERQRLTCNTCAKSFASLSSIREHYSSVHLRDQLHSCDHCEFTTHSYTSMRAHKRNKHSGRDPMVCAICGLALKSKDTYDGHMLRHYDLKPYKCSHCASCFASCSQRAQHERTHRSPEMVCDLCGKKFVTGRDLSRHLLVHSNRKDHACTLCEFRCNTIGNLRAHYKAMHDMVYPPIKSRPVARLNQQSTDEGTATTASVKDRGEESPISDPPVALKKGRDRPKKARNIRKNNANCTNSLVGDGNNASSVSLPLRVEPCV